MTDLNAQTAIKWNLRQLMADAGMFKTTDLIQPLRSSGVHLSREQVFRLVTKTPARLNMEVLAALCVILSCTPAQLIEVKAASQIASQRDGTSGSGGSVGSLRPIPARIHRPPTS